MPASHFIILYVDSPAASARFYSQLLDQAPIESSPTFAMFALEGGLMLGLWSKHTVEPAPAHAQIGGSSELAFVQTDRASVSHKYTQWKQLSVAFAQEPVDLDFGFTFVATDPDGHRLRVFTPTDA